MDEQAWNEYLESLQVCLQSAISLILTMWEQDARRKIMIPFKYAEWAWYDHFQDIWPSARARGAHAFVGGHDAAPATAVNLPSTPTSAPALLSTIMPSDAEMDETDPTMSILSAKRKNEASDFERLLVALPKCQPLSSQVMLHTPTRLLKYISHPQHLLH